MSKQFRSQISSWQELAWGAYLLTSPSWLIFCVIFNRASLPPYPPSGSAKVPGHCIRIQLNLGTSSKGRDLTSGVIFVVGTLGREVDLGNLEIVLFSLRRVCSKEKTVNGIVLAFGSSR